MRVSAAPMIPVRFGAEEGSPFKDRQSMTKIRQKLTAIKNEAATGKVGLIEKIEPARWANEIGYHCDFADTYRLYVGDQTILLDVTGYEGAPKKDYEFRAEDGSWELSLHDQFATLRLKNEGDPYLVTLATNQTGRRGETGFALREEKTEMLKELLELGQALEQSAINKTGPGRAGQRLTAGVYRYDQNDQSQLRHAADAANTLERQGVAVRRSGHTTPDKQGFVAVGKGNIARIDNLGDIYHKAVVMTQSLTHGTQSASDPVHLRRQMADANYSLPRDVRGAYRSFEASWQQMLKQLENLRTTSYGAIQRYIEQGQPLG